MSVPHQRRGLLPYGDTLHYQGCGCPATWTQGARAADVVDYVSQVKPHQHTCLAFSDHSKEHQVHQLVIQLVRSFPFLSDIAFCYMQDNGNLR